MLTWLRHSVLRTHMIQNNADPSDSRTYTVVRYAAYVGLPTHILLALTFALVDKPSLALFNSASTIVWLVAWFLNQRGHHSAALQVLVGEIIVQSSIMVTATGWEAGFQYYLLCTIPVTLFNVHLKNDNALQQAAAISGLYLLLFWISHFVEVTGFTPVFLDTMHYANIIVCVVALTIISYFFRQASITNLDRMRHVANTDFLTGLRNRRSMMALLEHQQRSSACEGTGCALVLLDIDHFKTFNDTHGHDCGDYVLTEVSKIMQSRLRSSDVIARWGGEEFLLLLPNTDARGAFGVADAVRTAVEEKRMTFAGRAISVTVTLGVAAAEKGNVELEQVLKRADHALYEGKVNGRNQVYSYVGVDQDPMTSAQAALLN